MVRVIYITSQKHFIPPNRMISNINDYDNLSKFKINNKYNKFDYCFDDWTSNFTDLLYWNTEIDLNNKILIEVLHKLSVAISRLKRENIGPKLYEPNYLLPEWWFGNTRISPNSCLTKNMPDKERKPILMLHLLNLYYRLKNICRKNKIYYCYVC
jgi:hypothetical protein